MFDLFWLSTNRNAGNAGNMWCCRHLCQNLKLDHFFDQGLFSGSGYDPGSLHSKLQQMDGKENHCVFIPSHWKLVDIPMENTGEVFPAHRKSVCHRKNVCKDNSQAKSPARDTDISLYVYNLKAFPWEMSEWKRILSVFKCCALGTGNGKIPPTAASEKINSVSNFPEGTDWNILSVGFWVCLWEVSEGLVSVELWWMWWWFEPHIQWEIWHNLLVGEQIGRKMTNL